MIAQLPSILESAMREHLQFFIDGAWVDPHAPRTHAVINPATEEPCARISLGAAADVDRAVAAARRAFPAWSRTSLEERKALFDRIMAGFQARLGDVAQAISLEMGAPMWLAAGSQAGSALAHYTHTRELLDRYTFESAIGSAKLLREPVGVCALITPWNWPANQIACKVAPALAAGCTMVLKPSELAPLDALILAEVLAEAGLPAGVFNLVNGDGPGVGAALAAHPDVDMISFTGSTRAGVLVAKAAADSVKRVAQELGGKSPNIILEDADLVRAVKGGVLGMMSNTGQSCNAPSRMFVPAHLHEEAAEIAAAVAGGVKVMAPEQAERGAIGPLANAAQFQKVQAYIEQGMAEGARLVAGGPGRPEGFNRGYFVRPTVFAGATNAMTIAREEIFGPVLTMIPYDDEAQAVAMANDTPYGLSAYVSGSPERAMAVARRLRAGNVHLNGAGMDIAAPFGGYKQSGNGREWGRFGLEEYLEVKAVMGG
jgi:aldehyde dehydrogenase (NAD+)